MREEVIERMEREEEEKQKKEEKMQRTFQRTKTDVKALTRTVIMERVTVRIVLIVYMVLYSLINFCTDEDEECCQKCGGRCEDDDEAVKKTWIGCDGPGCWRWFHFQCAGFTRKPSKSTTFLCETCKS